MSRRVVIFMYVAGFVATYVGMRQRANFRDSLLPFEVHYG